MHSESNSHNKRWKLRAALGLGSGFLALGGIVLAQQPGENTPPSYSNRVMFEADLMPVNSAQATMKSATGKARFIIDGDSVGIFIEGKGLAPSIMHHQQISLGKNCPDIQADSNKDGFVDAIEAQKVSGEGGLPLTLSPMINPNAPSTGQVAWNFPQAAQDGSLTYITSLPMNLLLTALSGSQPGASPSPTSSPGGRPTGAPSASPSPNPTSAPGASPTPAPSASPTASPHPLEGGTPSRSSPVSLENYVIEIRGVDPSTALPPSVQSEGDLPASSTLPVLCGKIVKVTTSH